MNNLQFYRLLRKAKIFHCFSQGKQNVCKSFFKTFHVGFLNIYIENGYKKSDNFAAG